MSDSTLKKPIVVIVRDGWGANPYREWDHANAVHLAHTPADERLMAEYPHVQIKTSGHDVGLPKGVMGNSEVGHQNIGAGRIVEQEVMRTSLVPGTTITLSISVPELSTTASSTARMSRK